MSDGEMALGNFTKKFNQEISKEYGFSLFGSGVSFPVKIERIILSYKANYCENIVGARKLAVDIAHKMIDSMNQDNNLLKYLSSVPASARHVNLTIIFKDPNNAKTPGALNSVMLIGLRDNLVFTTYNETMNMLVELHEESFEEAEKIVKQESSLNSTKLNE